MIIFLPILVYIILGIILKLFNFSSEIFDLLITFTVFFSINATLCLINIINITISEITNIINNISSNSYRGISLKSLLNCPDFQKDLFCAIAYFFNCIASLFYPIIYVHVYYKSNTQESRRL